MLKQVVIIQICLLMSVAEGQKCPPSSEISPCVCSLPHDAYLSCVSSIDTIYRTLDYVSANRLYFYSISLDSSTPERLRPDLLGNATTNRLNLYFENANESLNPFIFRGQEDNLKSIAFRGSKLSHIPVNALKDLRLKELHYVMDGSLTKLKKGVFEPLKHPEEIKDLYLYGNGIEMIEDDVFDPLENLETLFLDSNKLTTISADSFPNDLSRLKTLKLESNRITTVPLDIVRKMADNSTLNLKNNKIKEIPQQTLNMIMDKKLEVDLSGNPIHCGCSFLTFVSRYSESGANMNPDETTCSTPSRLDGVKLSELTAELLGNC